jgi:hypothetical protein
MVKREETELREVEQRRRRRRARCRPLDAARGQEKKQGKREQNKERLVCCFKKFFLCCAAFGLFESSHLRELAPNGRLRAVRQAQGREIQFRFQGIFLSSFVIVFVI